MKSNVDKLCPNCGLCCDSTLFADVKLRPKDDAKRLSQLGLLTRKAGGTFVFFQPCSCFDGKYCKIYCSRPAQCRAFECGLLKKVDGGEMDVDTALDTISKAKKLATRVRGYLRAFGQSPEGKPMAHCYFEAMSGPIDLSAGRDAARRHGRLMQAFGDLMRLLEKDFLQ